MKILIFSPIFPFPPDSGARIRIFNMIKILSKNHGIVLLTQADPEKDITSELEKYCQEVEAVHVSSVKGFKNLFARIKSLISSCPHITSREIQSSIKKILKKHNFDLVQFERLYLGPYHSLFGKLPTILDEFDVDSIVYKRKLIYESNPLKKFRIFIQWMRTAGYEKRMIPQFKKVIVASERDMEILQDISSDINVSVVSNGVDLEYFKPEDYRIESNSLFFTGLMSYAPNVDAMLYFYEETFPLIRKKIPDIRLYIMGANPPEAIRNLSKIENIIVTDYMGDMRPLVNKCKICIVPIRIGGGTRLKILEAMAMRKPVISTSVGAEGLDISPSENIIIADDPQDFANKTVELLRDSELRKRIIQGGRRLVESKYTWEASVQKLEALYEELIENNIRVAQK